MIPNSPAAHNLLHQGAIALARVEAAGMRVDVPYLEKTIARTARRVDRLQKRIVSSDMGQLWRGVYGDKTNFASGPQLGRILFDKMGFDPPDTTEIGRASCRERVLFEV